jgi:hypothetical protein
MRGLGPEAILLCGALAVGLVALAAWLVATRAKDRLPSEDASSSSPLFLLTGAAAALLLFLFTLPSRPPFAAGGQLGVGVLLGALSAALVAWGAGRRVVAASPLGVAGVLGAALAPAALVTWIYRGDPMYALMGMLLGQSVLLLFPEASLRAGEESAAAGRIGLFLGASAAAVAGVSLAIARYHDFRVPERLALGSKLWWSAPLFVLAAVVAGALVAALVVRTPAQRALVGLLVGAALLALFGARFPRYWPLMLPPAAGYATGALLVALAATAESDWQATVARRRALSALLGALLVLILLIAAYRLQAGLGIALAAIGFAGAALALPGDDGTAESSSPPHSSAVFTAGLQLLALGALFRLFYAAQGLESTSIYLTAHYALIGLVAGCLTPIGLGLLARATAREDEGQADPWLTPLAQGIAVVALPLAMLLLWGLKANAGVLLGLVAGQAFLLLLLLIEGRGRSVFDRGAVGDGGRAPGPASATGRAALAAPSSPVLLVAVVAIRLLPPLAPFTAELTRVQRAAVLLAVIALVPLWALWTRLRDRSREA